VPLDEALGIVPYQQSSEELVRLGSVDRKLMMTRVNIQRGQGENVAQSPGE
jgi:hypothetical protein